MEFGNQDLIDEIHEMTHHNPANGAAPEPLFVNEHKTDKIKHIDHEEEINFHHHKNNTDEYPEITRNNQNIENYDSLDDNFNLPVHHKDQTPQHNQEVYVDHDDVPTRQGFLKDQEKIYDEEEIQYQEDSQINNSNPEQHHPKEVVLHNLFNDFEAHNESNHSTHFVMAEVPNQAAHEVNIEPESISHHTPFDFHSVPTDQPQAEPEEHFVPTGDIAAPEYAD